MLALLLSTDKGMAIACPQRYALFAVALNGPAVCWPANTRQIMFGAAGQHAVCDCDAPPCALLDDH
jgi:hypothetical protein